MDLVIRPEAPQDFRPVEELTRDAFFNRFVPGCSEHYLMHILRDKPCFLPELSLVALQNGELVGHIAYTHAVVRHPDGREVPVLSFGPVSVRPKLQGQGIGGVLIRHSLRLAKDGGHKAVVILGDPDYYSRFGFLPAEGFGIGMANRHYLSSLQALELQPGTLDGLQGATFHEDAAFEMDEADIAAFDRGFPPRVPGPSPTQARFRELVNSAKPMPPLASSPPPAV